MCKNIIDKLLDEIIFLILDFLLIHFISFINKKSKIKTITLYYNLSIIFFDMILQNSF